MILVLVPVAIELIFLSTVGLKLYDATKEYERLERSRSVLLELHHFEQLAEQSLLTLAQAEDSSNENRISELKTLIKTLEIPWASKTAFLEHPELNAIISDSETARLNLIRILKQVSMRLQGHYERTAPSEKEMAKYSLLSTLMEVRPLSTRIIEVETDLLNSDTGQIEGLTQKLGVLLAGGAVIGFLVSLLLVRDFTAVFLSRLKAVANKAVLMAGGRDLPPPITGNDELAELDKVLLQANEELKNSRQKQFAILDNARDVLCTLDGRLRFMTIGDAVSKVWLYSCDDLLGLTLISIVEESTRETTRIQLTKLAETGGECEFENDVKRKDGSIRPFLWTISYSKEQGNYFCVAHDISEMKAAQQLKQQFLSTASEQMRAPLDEVNRLIGSIIDENLEQLPKAVGEEISKANYNLTRLNDLVAELLDLEDLETLERDIERLPLKANDVLTQARLTLEALAGAHSIKIDQLPGDASITGDKRRLTQAIINLLSNAIKFSPANSTVSLAVTAADNRVTISVSDQGPGIEEKDRELLFAKFQPSKSTNKSKIKGTGLGLSLVKSIAEAHGGIAGFRPASGGGSCFYIELPSSGGTEQ